MRRGADERVAIVMVDYNQGHFFERTLGLLREQTRRPDRILVVDNASSDGSPDAIEARFTEVEVLRLGRNAGFARANNAGVRAAEDCGWVALLNADAYPAPRWLEGLLDAARRRPEFASFSSRMMQADEPELLDGAGDLYHVSGLAWRRDHGRGLTETQDALEEEEVFAACGGAAMYRRDAYVANGGFDEEFFAYFEDTDLGFRLRLDGQRCLYVPGSVVHHVGSATTGAGSDFTVYHQQRNMVWTWVKNMPWPLALLYLPQHVLANAWTALAWARRDRGAVVLRAKRDAMLGLPRVLRQRRQVQARRRVGALALRRAMAVGAAPTRLPALLDRVTRR